jgi:hypothetical protein
VGCACLLHCCALSRVFVWLVGMDNTQQHASESEAQEQMRREQRRLRKLEKAQQRAAQHARFILTLPHLGFASDSLCQSAVTAWTEPTAHDSATGAPGPTPGQTALHIAPEDIRPMDAHPFAVGKPGNCNVR